MKWNRCYAAMLLVPVLVVGFALSTPRPARADDTAASIGGAILGALLNGAFDRDYPPGSLTFGRGYGYGGGNDGYCARGYGCGNERPIWFYFPQAGVFALPGSANPYPYGIRWWQFAGRYQQRLVFVPAMYEGWGNRETLRFPAQRPIFVLPNQQDARYPSGKGRVFGYGAPGYGYGGPGYGYGGQGYGYEGPGYAYGGQGRGLNVSLQYNWQPSSALQYYRSPAGGWRQGWSPQRDGWYDFEGQTWRQAPGVKDDKVSGAGPGQKMVKPPRERPQRREIAPDGEDPTPGPPQKVTSKFDESWRSEMRGEREGGEAKQQPLGGAGKD